EELEHEIAACKRAQEEFFRAKERAEAANRFKSQFLAGTSHALRTPLSAILGFSELLADQPPGAPEEKQRKYLEYVVTAGRELQQIMTDVLELARIDAEPLELRTAPVDVA